MLFWLDSKHSVITREQNWPVLQRVHRWFGTGEQAKVSSCSQVSIVSWVLEFEHLSMNLK